MTEQPTPQAAAQPAPAPASQPAKGGGFLANLRGKGEAKADGQEGGRVRTGAGYWSLGVFITGLASDIATPVAKWSMPLLVLFIIAAAVAAFFAFLRKPPNKFAQQAVGVLGVGVAVFGLVVVTQFAPSGDRGRERGVLAAIAPPIAAVQTTVLPLSPVEKELLSLSTDLNTGDPEARSAAARAALAPPAEGEVEDKPTRRALLERILRNPDANVQQAGIVQALADRSGAPVSIIPAEGAAEDDLRTQLTGAQLAFQRVNVDTGAISGVYAGGTGGNRSMDGSVANGRLIVNAQYYKDRAWKNGLVFDLKIDKDFKLVGTARTPEHPPVNVELPLL